MQDLSEDMRRRLLAPADYWATNVDAARRRAIVEEVSTAFERLSPESSSSAIHRDREGKQ